MKHLLLVLLLSLAAFAQQPTTQVAIVGPAPSGITSGSASPVGSGGGQTIFYYVIARYPSGIAYPAFSIQARNTAGIGNLSSQNSVVISWSGMSGATGYDVIRQATQTSPNNPCTGCAVVLNTTSTTATDTGANGGNYPPALPSVGDQTAVLQVDNISRSYPFPTVSVGGTRYQEALISSFTAGSPAAFDSQGRLVNGAAASSGTVTSVTAAAPLAASPNPIVGAGTISADTTVLAQKFFGTTTPGSVAGNLPGDLYTDTTNHVEYYCGKAAGTSAPACTAVGTGNWTSSSGTGTVSSVGCGTGLTGGTITTTGTCAVDTTLIAQKFFGTAAPGSVASNLPGDTFSDTTNHNDYWCNAPSGTAAPACTSVTTGGWTLLNASGGTTVTAAPPYVTISGTVYGPIYTLTQPPAIGSWTWVNQNGATANTTNGYLNLITPLSTGDNFNLLVLTAPATPYTRTAYINFIYLSFAGIAFRQSSDGKIVVYGFADNSGATSISVIKYTNPTTFSAVYKSQNQHVFNAPGMWLRIADDGANRICSFSLDGTNFTVFHTIGRTDFLTADQVGIAINANSSTTASILDLLSWN